MIIFPLTPSFVEEPTYITMKTAFILFTILIPSFALSQSNQKDPYEMMSVAFEGRPSKRSIEVMMEAVLKRHGYERNYKNRMGLGSVLIELRKNNNQKIVEMDILRHMYLNGVSRLSIEEQAALSMTLLKSKN